MRAIRIGVLAAVCTMSVFAGPLTITYTSSGTGSIGSTSFTNDSFTITELLDTSNIQSFSGGLFINDNSASIAITGVGTFAFTTPTRSFVNNDGDSEGFSRAGISGVDLLYPSGNPAFFTWDMTTSLGPFTGTGELLQWSNSPVQTTGGTLVFNTGSETVTFQAVAGAAAPEPASMALAGLASMGLGLFAYTNGMIRRRELCRSSRG